MLPPSVNTFTAEKKRLIKSFHLVLYLKMVLKAIRVSFL